MSNGTENISKWSANVLVINGEIFPTRKIIIVT